MSNGLATSGKVIVKVNRNQPVPSISTSEAGRRGGG